ncbi:hypothetical protein Q3G72_010343 [Acer saccharum]|nr:hypothetical protein Q3G72_010343 [Acer saccharum]
MSRSEKNGTIGKGKSVAFIEPDLLADKLSKLENGLIDYQYQMRLLLIEKKGWSSKYEELKLTLAEVKDTIKREQVTHLITITDVEKREVNLRKAFGLENHRVSDYIREDYGSEENNMETEKKQWAAYIKDLLNLKSELEKIRVEHEQ